MLTISRIKLLLNYHTLIYFIAVFIISFDLLSAQESVNIMLNGDFDTGIGGWTLRRNGSASGTISLSDSSVLSGRNSLKAVIDSGGDSLSHCRVSRSLLLETGRYYSISFMAVANSFCNIQPVFSVSSTSTTTIWEGPVQTVNETPQHFGPFVFRDQLSDGQHPISFQVGGQNDFTIWIDSVVVDKTDDPEDFREEEILVQTVTDTMNNLIANSDNQYYKMHCQSIIEVIKYFLLSYDYSTLESRFVSYTETNVAWNPKYLSSYLERQRSFIISWISPTDGSVSFAKMVPPKDWDPEQEYPLYISLHGLWAVADNPIDYLTYNWEYAVNEPFDDGYLIMPWGRGNLWYEGISETDIWECIDKIESIVKVNQDRKYLMGHSMGGYGTWSIGQKSTDVWAAIGVHAGALQWDNYKLLTTASAQKLKDTPVFFICGDDDGLYSLNQIAYQYLQDAGNTRIAFETFDGGHVYLYDNLVRINEWIKQWTKNSTEVENGNLETPSRFVLYDNYPNPFNPSTKIRYEVPLPGGARGGLVTLKVYDILGREVATLVNEEKTAGEYEVEFNGYSDKGLNLSSGVYFYQLRVEGSETSSGQKFAQTKKMILLR